MNEKSKGMVQSTEFVYLVFQSIVFVLADAKPSPITKRDKATSFTEALKNSTKITIRSSETPLIHTKQGIVRFGIMPSRKTHFERNEEVITVSLFLVHSV